MRFQTWAGFWIPVLVLAIGVRASAQSPTTQPFPGITFHQQVLQNPPMRMYWVQADLSDRHIHLRVCPGSALTDGLWQTTLLPVYKIVAREHLEVAVNGSFFASKNTITLLGRKVPYYAGDPATACGWTVSDGRLWTTHPFSPGFPTLVVARSGGVLIGRVLGPPRDAWQAVSGCAMLVQGGRNVGPDDAPAPHTAAGLDASGKLLTLFVVDGRRPTYSKGLSMKQVAAEMIGLGCETALCLDSGGSTTLVMRENEKWNVINTPSDGHDLPLPISIERSVANAFGIVVDR
jgi:hypothetical protein